MAVVKVSSGASFCSRGVITFSDVLLSSFLPSEAYDSLLYSNLFLEPPDISRIVTELPPEPSVKVFYFIVSYLTDFYP